MTTIPARAIVAVTPSVLAAGGQGLDLNGVILTTNDQVPTDTMQPFSSANDVATYFGPSSQEATLAQKYFAGFDKSNIKPGLLYFAQYNTVDVGGYLRGGDVTSLTLAELGALTGSLTVLLDGYVHTAASVNLSGASSYSNAASIIQTALFATEPTEATSSAASIAGNNLTIGGSLTGVFAPGQTITGAGVTPAVILSQTSGSTGGAGVYVLSGGTQTVSSEAMTAKATAGTVSFDSISGGFVVASGITGAPSTAAFATGTLAPSIFLTQATGAVLSQGAESATPSAYMTNLSQISQNWATFMLAFDPDNGSGNDQKMLFAEWNATQNDRWMYVASDSDQTPLNTVPAPTSMGNKLAAANISGTMLIYDSNVDVIGTLAAFVCGTTASIDFTETQGRITFAFKGQSGLAGEVTNETQGNNLITNGYNFYGAYATANQQFIWLYPGLISGEFLWADSYVNQIWLNNSFQLNLMVLLQNTKSIPYTQPGRLLIEAAMQDTVNAGLNFGAFSPGVNLSEAQKAEVNNSAGANIVPALNQQGYYIQVLQAAPDVRAQRRSPPCTFWYCDAGAVQQINLASIELQ